MTTTPAPAPRQNPWRWLIWGGAAALLALPAVAMQFTSEVRWDETDFLVMGVLLAAVAGAIDFVTSRRASAAVKLGGALAALGVLLLVWVNLAVGMIGDEGDPANWSFAGVIALIVGGAIVTRLSAEGMMRVMVAAAAVQVAIALAALAMGWGQAGPAWPRDVIGTAAIWATIWLASAALFRAGRR